MEVARQSSSPSLCASPRAVPWADEAEQQLSRLALSASQLSADVCNFTAELPDEAWQGTPSLRIKFELARQGSSLSLCASVSAVPWADEAVTTAFQANPFRLPAICRSAHFRSRATEESLAGTPPIARLRLKFELARQASSPGLCASVQAVQGQMRLINSFPG